jgi:hypothetical protein
VDAHARIDRGPMEDGVEQDDLVSLAGTKAAPDSGFDSSRGDTGRAAHVHTFQPADFDVGSAVKWAIEKATGIPCVFRGGDLLAEATPGTANKLAKVVLHITQSFQTLLDKLSMLNGVTTSDRTLFVRGLYDGMMNDGRGIGEPLPSRTAAHVKRTKAKKGAVATSPGLASHPYTVALSLGKQIRFATPLEEITAELERATQLAISPGRPAVGGRSTATRNH